MPSLASTVRICDDWVSWSSASATVITPLVFPMANLAFTGVIEYDTASPASGSVAKTVPTGVPLAPSSLTEKL